MKGRVILVQRRLRNEKNMLYELRELAESAGYIVVDEIEQVRPPDPKYNIGRGKVEELKTIVYEKDVEKVIFFNELKPSHAYNLRKALRVDVIDRFELILEIFANRAGSKEAKLQIELARLKRELSFAKEYISLAKRGELHGFLGGGKYAVDAYYTYVNSRISKIERELEKIRRQKNNRWKKRVKAGLYTVALTGYTGAGKTTLFNRLTGQNRYIDGKPFATLSTVSKRIRINGLPILVSDTIGFIDSLPETLFDAFYTTLGESTLADLLLLVVDISEPEEEIKRKILASVSTLYSLAIPKSKILLVANKIDKINKAEREAKRSILEKYTRNIVEISALNGEGIEELKEKILEMLPERTLEKIYIETKTHRNIIKEIESKCRIVSIKPLDGGIIELTIEGRKEVIEKYKRRVENVVLEAKT
ncbi:MAG: GTPase HflX [Thermoprotei archaeon]|nr:MAG: GTPase HflX [Thermoprotei archaeon]